MKSFRPTSSPHTPPGLFNGPPCQTPTRSILFTVSMAALFGLPQVVAYSAAKSVRLSAW